LWLRAAEGVVRSEELRKLDWAGPGDPSAGPELFLLQARV